MFTIKESRAIEPSTFAHLVSSTLYSRRFGPYFTEPVLAGLERTPSGGFKPYIAGADLIGCLNRTLVRRTCLRQLARRFLTLLIVTRIPAGKLLYT
jgi:20S proteasome alpha/beta subunit